MIFRRSYRRELFLYFLMVFVVFTTVISIIQYNREKEYKVSELKSMLNTYSDFVHSSIMHNNIGLDKDFSKLDSIKNLIPRHDIRITVTSLDGTVLYDSFYKNYSEMSNHLSRAEFQGALFYHTGSDIRQSATTKQDFYYYAKKYDNYFIRSAVVYSVNIRELLRVESLFWYVMAILFLVTSTVLLYVSDTVGKSILKLKDFAVKAARNENIELPVEFPNNELGEIGHQIVNIYSNLNKANIALSNEKDKLIHHIQISQEGIAIFSEFDEKILANNFFIQYMNLISDRQITNANQIHEIPEFEPIRKFKERFSTEHKHVTDKTLPVKRISISKNLRYFDVQCIIFHDKSYEIAINDVTQSVKQKKLKQEMTSNIAHELRTPVSSIKGYLETILSGKEIPVEKQRYFLEKATSQIERLSELIRDISVLTKIDESSELYQMEEIALKSVVGDVIENLHSHIVESKASVENKIKQNSKIKGNRALIFSIFQNLIENSLNYGGDNIAITIDEYMDDKHKVYVSVSDNGPGIEEEHQVRIFERFYRVDKGRNRETGGTGLGLAIVKNAVELHGSKINVKTRKGGGVEFLFTLNKVADIY
jgi:two-component system, OmpR family, phosphate regulon sensor histidine kinase PhoR